MKIIDSHSHISLRSYFGVEADPDAQRLLRELDVCHIEAALVSALDGICTTELRQQQEANRRLAKLQKKYQGRLFGLATVNPLLGKAVIPEIRRCKEDLQLRGIKLHPWVQAFSVMFACVQYTFEAAARFHMPILFHDGTPPYAATMQIAHIAHKYPELTIVLGHGGLKDLWPDALQAAQRHKNIHISTCGTPFLGIRTMLKELGPQRLMFGSDSGFSDPATTLYQLNNIRKQELSPRARKMVLSGNVERIFHL